MPLPNLHTLALRPAGACLVLGFRQWSVGPLLLQSLLIQAFINALCRLACPCSEQLVANFASILLLQGGVVICRATLPDKGLHHGMGGSKRVPYPNGTFQLFKEAYH